MLWSAGALAAITSPLDGVGAFLMVGVGLLPAVGCGALVQAITVFYLQRTPGPRVVVRLIAACSVLLLPSVPVLLGIAGAYFFDLYARATAVATLLTGVLLYLSLQIPIPTGVLSAPVADEREL